MLATMGALRPHLPRACRIGTFRLFSCRSACGRSDRNTSRRIASSHIAGRRLCHRRRVHDVRSRFRDPELHRHHARGRSPRPYAEGRAFHPRGRVVLHILRHRGVRSISCSAVCAAAWPSFAQHRKQALCRCTRKAKKCATLASSADQNTQTEGLGHVRVSTAVLRGTVYRATPAPCIPSPTSPTIPQRGPLT